VAAAGKDSPENIFIIGGEQIFRLGLAVANKVYATEIHAHIDGDTFFPALNKNEWKESSRQAQPAENGLEYDFVVYEKS
ncbi:MAG: dihydrofolate reductase, partial [Alcaligenaceae bacterium]|nr:dihydrofolate reductase [Alcaligenaceae bacterium]